MSKELIPQRCKLIAAVIGFVLFAVAIIKLPVELGRGRDFILGLFQLGVLVVFFVILWKINKWVALFLVLAVVSRTVPAITIESQNALKCVLYGLGWYFFVYHFANDEFLMDVICVIAFVHFMATAIQYFVIPSIFVGAMSGLTYNSNEGATMFALCFPAFLQKGRKRYLPIVIVGLAMIKSFGGTLAVAIGAMFYLCLLGHYWIVAPVVVLLGLFWWFIDVPSIRPRWTVWGNAFKMYLTHWKWGCGLGHWETISYKLAEANIQLLPGNRLVWTRLHNTFLNGLIEMGVGFGVLVSIYIVDLFRRYIKRAIIPFTAVIITIVCCSTNSMFRMNAVNAMIAITWLAILETSLRKSQISVINEKFVK